MTIPTGAPGVQKAKIPGYNTQQLSTLSPEQQQLFSSVFGNMMPGLQSGIGHLGKLASGDQSAFEQLERPALSQFSSLMGGLSSRLGGAGLRRSGGTGLAGSTAAADLAERLQGQRLGLQQNAIQQLLGLSQSLLGRQSVENVTMQKQRPAWQEFLMAMAPGLGQGLGSAATMGMGNFLQLPGMIAPKPGTV